jgi:diacylglycerol kinase
MKKHANAIKNAWNGIVWGFQTQPNYKIHIALSLLVILAGIFLNISYTEWLILIVAMVMGFVLETLNTAVEQLGDAVDRNYNEYIKRAKDSAAGAMLLFSFGAIIIAGWIFIPKILELLF